MGLLRRHDARDEADFVAYYRARADILRNTAYVLCGDWHLAQDLTQTTFAKLYRFWHRIERREVLDQYARQVLLRTFLDERRRPWRRESATAPGSADLDTVSPPERSDDRMMLRSALLRLPRQRRAVLVLRFWADLSVEQVAQVLRCPTGTVKSQTSRGLAELRVALRGALLDASDRPGQ